MVALALRGLVMAPLEVAADNAQMALARSYYERGDAAYNRGNFNEAAGWFAKSYDAWPATDLLYNIAQSYRRSSDCNPALVAYRRYLSLKEQPQEVPLTAQERADIERFIEEAAACVASASTEALSASPSTDPAPAVQLTSKVDRDGISSSGGDASQRVSVYAAGGTAWFNTGGELDIPAQPSFVMGGRYSLPVRPIIVEIGGRGAFSPIRYDVPNTRRWASLLSAVATVGSAYPVSRKFSIQLEVGAGLARLGGLVAYNPFTVTRNAGTFTMFSLRVGGAIEYAITPRLRAMLPSVGLSWFLGPDELASRVLEQLEVQLGVGYRM
jgi:hypothetical protein